MGCLTRLYQQMASVLKEDQLLLPGQQTLALDFLVRPSSDKLWIHETDFSESPLVSPFESIDQGKYCTRQSLFINGHKSGRERADTSLISAPWRARQLGREAVRVCPTDPQSWSEFWISLLKYGNYN